MASLAVATLPERPRSAQRMAASRAAPSTAKPTISGSTVVIAHRRSTIVDADEILVLDRGRIIERGAHARLVAAGGLYADLWRRQAEHPVLADG